MHVRAPLVRTACGRAGIVHRLYQRASVDVSVSAQWKFDAFNWTSFTAYLNGIEKDTVNPVDNFC